ncbi:MFS transporter [Kineococcus rhizosphaerae]|uniref:Putative MFS family arabinose efflux permease n=1 Tax=Kineococcus rhizosphaerae TaxID=559628 RepID=A0A2T0RAW9_9ACTN|nr:MFS transporter [Kineococcus rhizosphaerae]PRY18303.1 putative MFS family arabinose efflux permease [Kineococcus rhizosphaerae]
MSTPFTRVRYEHRLVAIFFLAWGLIFLDRQALSILMPLMIKDIDLTNGEIGQINMWQTICYALAAPTFALLADRLGNRKRILLIAVFATSLLSAATTAAHSLSYLIVVRSLLGIGEGVILPLAVALVALESRPGRLGRNVGLVYAGAAVIASTIGPVVVTQVASATTWRTAFLFISVPSFLAGVLVWAFVREPQAPVPATGTASGTAPGLSTREAVRAAFGNRNVLVCVVISVFAMAGLWTFNSYITLYLTQVSHLTVTTAGFVMSAFGIFTIGWQVFLPYSSDRIGRRPAMVLYGALAAVSPALLFLFPRSAATLVVYVVVGGVFLTLTALFTSIIPVESVPAGVMATASALIMGIGELLGAFVVGGAGTLADSRGLGAVMAAAAIAYVLVAITSLALRETRRRVVDAPLSAPSAVHHPVL